MQNLLGKFGTANAICWNSLGLFREYGLNYTFFQEQKFSLQIVNSSRILPRKKKLNPRYTQTKSWYVLYGSSFSRFSQQGAIEYNQSITQPAIKLSIEKQLLHIATFWETFRLQTITTLLVRGVLYHKKQFQLSCLCISYQSLAQCHLPQY